MILLVFTRRESPEVVRLHHRVGSPLPRALLLVLVGGCPPAGSDGGPCQKDADCKGDRICGPDGMCIDPGATTGGPAGTTREPDPTAGSTPTSGGPSSGDPTTGGPDATTGSGATSDGATSGSTAGTSTGGAADPDNACACEACGGHGTCVLDGEAPTCQCDPGYVADGLDCKPAPGVFGATYFVDPGGSDTNPGTSEQKPLKTIAKALSLAKAGDAVRLAPGATFTEAINIPQGYGGQPGKPITITSDPIDRATLKVGAGTPAIYLYDASFVTIENLVVSGPGAGATTKEGIGMMSDGAHEGITVRNVEVSGFYRGVFVYGAGVNGYAHLLFEGLSLHDNLDAGLATYADTPGAHHDVIVRRSVAYKNLGDPAVKRPSGDGIVLGCVTDGLIETSVAHDNGGNGTNSAGPVGIWTYLSTRVTIQYNESYSNHAKLQDGDGFDLDIGVTDSVMQYNYSHDNDGAGLILCQSGSAPWSGNVVRYNVSVDDARKQKMGSLTWCDFGPGPGLKDSSVYGNTIVNAYGPAINPTLLATSTGHVVFNNVFVTSNGQPVVWNWNGVTTAGRISFTGNLYWSSGVPADFEGSATLDAWRVAQGQETLDGAPVGLFTDPRLVPYAPACASMGKTAVSRTPGLRVAADSPTVDAGLSPSEFVMDPGPHDFWGTPLPQGPAFDLGAEERLP